MPLRDYQHRAISELRKHYRDRPLLCLPTGAGKTTVAAEVIRSAVENGNRCIFLVHRRELVDQAVARLKQFGIRAGRILAGHRERRRRPVQVASIPTLIRREHWPAQLVIVDECAHAVSKSWSDVLERYSGSWIIGLTATPIRLDGRGLGDMFGCILEPVTTAELVKQGYLVEPEVWAPPVDLKGIKVVRGDYSLPQLAERMNKLVGSLTETWKQRGGGRTVAFAVNVKHSHQIVEAFRSIGVAAEHIDGGTATKQRAATLARLRSGETTLVSNCMVLSEGWDLPELRCAILARPTKSLALYRQMVGRVMRPPGPVTVLDHAGNTHEHGPVTDDIEWSLEGPMCRVASAPSTRTCESCFAVYSSVLDECPQCGHRNETEREVEDPGVENPGELVRIEMGPRKATLQEKQREYRRYLAIASERGYRLGWARMRYKDMYGVWPRLREMEKAEYHCGAPGGHEWEPAVYGPRRVTRCSWCFVEKPICVPVPGS